MSDPARPLNLLVVTNDLFVGGVQRNVVRYFRHFDRERFRLHLATVCASGPLAEEIRAAGAMYAHIRAIAGLGPAKTITPWGVLRLAALMRQWRIDVVQTRLFLGNTIGRLAARLAGVPVVVAAEHSTYFGKTWAHIAIDRALARRTDRIVAVSRVVADFTARQEGIPAEKFVVIYNGLDLPRFAAPVDRTAVRRALGIEPGAFVLGSVSRLIPEKGFVALVRLLPRILAGVPGAVFLLVGDGEERGNIERAAADANVSAAVRMVGERGDVPELLAAMDLFVLPSRREGLPTAVLEAMAAGIPVLTHDLPQFREVVTDGRDGVIADFDEPEAAVGAVLRLARDAALRAALAEKGRRRAWDFSVERMVAAYRDLYLTLWREQRDVSR